SEQKETPKQEEQTQTQNTDDTIVLAEEHQPLEFTVGAVDNLITNTGNPFIQDVPKNDYGKVFKIKGDQEIIARNTVKGIFRQRVRQGEKYLFLTNVEVI